MRSLPFDSCILDMERYFVQIVVHVPSIFFMYFKLVSPTTSWYLSVPTSAVSTSPLEDTSTSNLSAWFWKKTHLDMEGYANASFFQVVQPPLALLRT